MHLGWSQLSGWGESDQRPQPRSSSVLLRSAGTRPHATPVLATYTSHIAPLSPSESSDLEIRNLLFTQEEVDIVLVDALVHAVSRSQHVPGADEASSTQPLTCRGTYAAQTENNIPGILMGASLIASSNPRGSVHLATFTIHSRTCCGRW